MKKRAHAPPAGRQRKERTAVDEKTVKAAESILARGERVELVPVKNGVRVLRVRRETVLEAAASKARAESGGARKP